MSHDDRALKSPEHVPDLVLGGLGKRRPFRLDGFFGDLANLRLQISKPLVARTVVAVLPIVGTLSFRGHFGLDNWLVDRYRKRLEEDS